MTLTDRQVQVIEDVIDCLMRVDIGLREDMAKYIPVHQITDCVIAIVDAFEHADPRLHQSFGETGLRRVVSAKKALMEIEDSDPIPFVFDVKDGEDFYN